VRKRRTIGAAILNPFRMWLDQLVGLTADRPGLAGNSISSGEAAVDGRSRWRIARTGSVR
jgi:hypothetical protein